MEPPLPRIEFVHRHIFRDKWRWVLIGGHGELMARSPWYPSKASAKVAASAARHVINAADIWNPSTPPRGGIPL